jgi:putative transposase
VWAGDVTYIKVSGVWHHLAVVMDLYSRRILGWTLSKPRTVDITLSALGQALKKRKPDVGCLFHSDRGVEYVAYRYRDELKKYGMIRSVNRPGMCTDNAHVESFFHSLKTEMIRGRKFKDQSELRYALNSYINGFYNYKRLHSGINYLPPTVYEKIAA